MATLEIDKMEYSSDALARAAYVESGGNGYLEMVDQQQLTDNSDAGLGNVGGITYYEAQSFQLSGTIIISAVEVKQNGHTGSPTGNWTLRIETNNVSGKPSGTLANANASVVVSPPGDNTIVKGTFSTAFTLNGSTTYWLVINCAAQTSGNYWNLGLCATNTYANGVRDYWSSSNGIWNPYTDDLYFKVYANIPSPTCYFENAIKTQGSYSLKVIALATISLTGVFTKTFSVNSDLTGVKNIKFDMYASRTGANIKIGIHDTGGTTTEITPSIITANTWQTINWSISAVTDGNKDAIDKVVITITNADADNTFYLDNFVIDQAIDVFGIVI